MEDLHPVWGGMLIRYHLVAPGLAASRTLSPPGERIPALPRMQLSAF